MNARLILDTLDRYLDAPVELTLYGRAALQFGFADPPPETLLITRRDQPGAFR